MPANRQGETPLNRPICFAVALILLATAHARAQSEIQTRTANDGNVVLEAIPEIPQRIVDDLNRYQNTRSATFQDWTVDGTGIYVITRFGDTRQLHHVATPGGARRQLTFLGEPVAGADRQPRGRQIRFSMDEGGGEFYQLFLLDPETGEHRRLTDGESRNVAAVWSNDGQRVAYRSTRRNGRSNDVWTMDIANPESAWIVLEAPDTYSWGPVDWTADGKQLLVQHYVSSTQSSIHVLDLETGQLRLIAGDPERPTTNFAAAFDATDTGIYLITDSRGEFRQLAHIDLDSGELEVITGDIPWDVDGFEFSDDGTRAAFDVNEGGVERLYLLDPATHEYRSVSNIPVGRIFGLEFSPDGRQLAMTLNTAKTPSDAFTLDLSETAIEAGELVRWTYSEVGGLDTDHFVEPELIYYPTFDEVDGEPRQVPAFVYKPRDGGSHPVIVYIHGGPESQYRPGFSSVFQMSIAKLGAAIVAPNVRGSSGYGKEYLKLDNGFLREDSVKDIGALLDWIAEQADLDEKRIAVVGGSYGGYMVLASLMHYSDRLAAGVEIVGISNFVGFLEDTQDYRRDRRRAEYGDERDPKMREFLERISPSNNAGKITAPLFVAQGQNDPRVPVTESEKIVREVREAGYDVWYMNALNEGHGFRKKENGDLYGQIMILFLEEHL
jgi:dipeptidyl aminopeptidase/acylaminoacyl peptidase